MNCFKNKFFYLRKAGFTLLEVMFALSLVSISFLILINSFSLVAKSYTRAANYTKAMFLLKKKLYSLKTQEFSSDDREGIFNAPFERFNWRLNKEAASLQDLTKIALSVYWTEEAKTRELEIITYLDKQSQ